MVFRYKKRTERGVGDRGQDSVSGVRSPVYDASSDLEGHTSGVLAGPSLISRSLKKAAYGFACVAAPLVSAIACEPVEVISSKYTHVTQTPQPVGRTVDLTKTMDAAVDEAVTETLEAIVSQTATGATASETATETPEPSATPSATASETAVPSATNTATATYTATATATPEPTATPVPLEGRLFFDMNGSGLWEAGEPPIADFGVCISDKCVNTDAQGEYCFANSGTMAGRSVRLLFRDPNGGNPQKEMRYINKWEKSVIIPAYTMNGVQVPEQDLNDTEIIPLENGIYVVVGKDNRTGLMQGFLTLPFRTPFQGTATWCDIDSRVGYVENWMGEESPVGPDDRAVDTLDQHDGIDFCVPVGVEVLAAADGRIASITHDTGQQSERDFIVDIFNPTTGITMNYGHVDILPNLSVGDIVQRGDIIGYKTHHVYPPFGEVLHFGLYDHSYTTRDRYLVDPYRLITDPGSVSYWTVDNNPRNL